VPIVSVDRRATRARISVRAFTISELERHSGVRRGVIHFYLNHGLLPPAHKASATRALYAEEHLELLREISALKYEGLSLEQIRERLSARIAKASSGEVDLAADQLEQRRTAILEEAARQFAEKGYNHTRISDIVRAVGSTPLQLYSFFPSKHHLFVACYKVFFRWMAAQVEPPAVKEADPAARLAWRMYGNLGIHALSPELIAFVQAEAVMSQGGELPELIRSTFQSLHGPAVEDFRQLRREGKTPSLLSDELISYAMQGAFDRMLMRASWDKKHTKLDAMRNAMAMFLAVEAVYQGRTDISERWAQVEKLVDRLCRKRPPGPPPRTAA
jgi:AcrR family transcriptional regulator